MNEAQKQQTVHLLIRNRDKIIFDEEVKAVTSINDKGTFDILPEHTNFISIIKRYVLIHKVDGTKQVLEINNGVLKIRDGLINCYIDIIPPEIATPAAPAITPSAMKLTAEKR